MLELQPEFDPRSWSLFGARATLIVLSGILLSAGLSMPGLTAEELLLPGVLLATCLTRRFYGFAWFMAGLAFLALSRWASSGELGSPAPEAVPEPLIVLALLLVLAPWLAQWGSATPAAWSGLAAVGWVALFWVFAGADKGGFPDSWRGLAALGCAVVALLLAVPGALRLAREPGSKLARAAVAPLLAAAVLLVGQALPLELGRGAWQAVGCALAVPAVTWLAVRLRVEHLRSAAVVLAGLSIVWLFAERAELAQGWEPRAWVGWVYGLGVPLLALCGAAILAHSAGEASLAKRLEVLVLLLATLFATLGIRWLAPYLAATVEGAFWREALIAPLKWSLSASPSFWILSGGLSLAIGRALDRATFLRWGYLLIGMGAVFMILISLLFADPDIFLQVALWLALAALFLWISRQKKSRSGSVAVLLLAALPAHAANAPSAAGTFYTRGVEVPSAGWVRVPLEVEVLPYFGPYGQGLRVTGPRGEEIPAAVEFLQGTGATRKAETRTVPIAPVCRSGAGASVCNLRLPGVGQHPASMRLELTDGAPAGFRLYTARAGRWWLLSEGVWESPAEKIRTLEVRRRLHSENLRLELYGAGSPPRLSSVEVDLVAPNVLFEAPSPGTYRLIYGEGALQNEEDQAPHLPEGGTAAWIEPGTELTSPLPPLDGAVVSHQDPLQDLPASANWAVRAPGAVPGEVVRLEIPMAAYLRAGSLARLRLEAGGHRIPFVRWSPPEPALASFTRVHPEGTAMPELRSRFRRRRTS